MSKTSKKAQRDRRKNAKAQHKATMRAQYALWTEEGRNQKSKRSLKGKRWLVKSSKHPPDLNCGNPGCKKCFPGLNTQYLGQPSSRPPWISKKHA